MSASQAERHGFDPRLPLQPSRLLPRADESRYKSSVITLYVLQSSINGKRYVGITNNLQRRLLEHRSHGTKAGQLLKDFVVLHTETFKDHTEARRREKWLKSGQGREWLTARCPSRSASGG